MRCPDLKEIGGSVIPCNNLLQGPGTPFVLHENKSVTGKWREGICDYVSAAAVECVDYACLPHLCTKQCLAAPQRVTGRARTPVH